MLEALTIPKNLFAAMIRQLQEDYPLEGCGLLAGREGAVTRHYAIDNHLRSPVAYEMEPVQQLQALLDLEQAGLQLLAIYHSHPGGPQTPSQSDIAKAYYPGVAHLIISLQDYRQPVTRAFLIEGDGYREIAWQTV